MSQIVVTDAGTIVDIIVQLDISHTRDSDLDVLLRSPSGIVVELFSDEGGNGDEVTDTVFDDEAPGSIDSGRAPFIGSYRPEGELSQFDCEGLNGTWTLEVYDDKNGQTGTFNGWSIIVEHTLE